MTLTHYIGGAEIGGTSGRAQDVFNPATGTIIDQVPLASAAEVDGVVAVASKALLLLFKTRKTKRPRQPISRQKASAIVYSTTQL